MIQILRRLKRYTIDAYAYGDSILFVLILLDGLKILGPPACPHGFLHSNGSSVSSPCCFHAGAELHAWLAVQAEVEDHCSGLYMLSPCREHEEEEPDRLQHGGG